jgi:hypothetical protein
MYMIFVQYSVYKENWQILKFLLALWEEFDYIMSVTYQ